MFIRVLVLSALAGMSVSGCQPAGKDAGNDTTGSLIKAPAETSVTVEPIARLDSVKRAEAARAVARTEPIVPAGAGQVAQAAGHTYAGVKACSMCHKTEKQGGQFGIWGKTKHAQAYTTLTTQAANDIAKAKGITTPAAKSPACLKCHAIVGDAKADVKDGVQCEVCHGPGSDYKSLTVMKNKGRAVAAGLKEYKDKAAIEKQCRTCHNEKSPTAKEFKFEERWAKIRHPRPKNP